MADILQGASVTPTNVQPGSALAADMMRFMGNTAKATEQVAVATEKAETRMANINLADMSRSLIEYDKGLTPSSDYRQAQQDVDAIYSHFRNASDSEFYTEMFDQHGLTGVGKMKLGYENTANKVESTANFEVNKINVRDNIQAGQIIDSDSKSNFMDSVTAGGFIAKADAEKGFSDVLIQGLEGKYETYKNLPIYNADGTINRAVASNLYDEIFSTQSRMDMNGKVTGVGDTSEDVVNAQQNAFRKLMDFTLADKTQEAETASKKPTMDLDIGSVRAKDMVTAANANLQRLEQGKADGTLKVSGSVIKGQKNYVNELLVREQAVNNAESRAYNFIKGGSWESTIAKTEFRYTTVDGHSDFITVGEAEVAKYIQQEVLHTENEIRTGEGDKRAKIKHLVTLTQRSNGAIKSPYLTQTTNDVGIGIYTGGDIVGNIDTAYINHRAKGGEEGAVWFNKQAIEKLAIEKKRLDADETLSTLQKNMKLRSSAAQLEFDYKRVKPTRTAIGNVVADRGADLYNNTLGEQALASGALGILAETWDVDVPVTEDTFDSELKRRTVLLSTDFFQAVMPLAADDIGIIKPAGAGVDGGAITDRLFGDALMVLKSTEIAEKDYMNGRSTISQVALPNGELSTTFTIRDNNGAVVHRQTYSELELLTPLGKDDQAKIDEIKKSRGNSYFDSASYREKVQKLNKD